jgi:hypothetical protein
MVDLILVAVSLGDLDGDVKLHVRAPLRWSRVTYASVVVGQFTD